MYINNPSVPYYGTIDSRLHPGTIIKIRGQSHSTATFFAISFQCGPSTSFQDDVALYLSTVFTPPPRIIRNSLISSRWGPEESFGGFPTGPGQPFEFVVMVEPNEFKIALNGSHFTEFRHRIAYDRISNVTITGEVRIELFSIESSMSSYSSVPPVGGMPPYPSAPPYSGSAPYPSASSGPGYPGSYNTLPSNPMPMPYSTDPGGLYPSLGATAPYPQKAPSPLPSAYPTAYPSVPVGSYYQSPSGGQYPPGGNVQYSPGGNVQYPPGGSGQYPPPPPGYQPNEKSSKGIGGMLGPALAAVTGGAAATAIGSKLLGHKQGGMMSNILGPALNTINPLKPHKAHKGPKSSGGIPIGTLAAGAGAAALGAAVLSGHHPFKKAKKLFKHKHKGKWSHKGWSSSSGSSSSEEE